MYMWLCALVGSQEARADSPTLQHCFFQLSALGMDPVILQGGYSAFHSLYPFLCTPRMVLLELERRSLPIYPSEILEVVLYQGSASQAHDYRIIKNLHITHVVNVTAEISDSFPSVLHYHQWWCTAGSSAGPSRSFSVHCWGLDGVVARCWRWDSWWSIAVGLCCMLFVGWRKDELALPRMLDFFSNSLTTRNCCLVNGSSHWMTSVSEKYWRKIQWHEMKESSSQTYIVSWLCWSWVIIRICQIEEKLFLSYDDLYTNIH